MRIIKLLLTLFVVAAAFVCDLTPPIDSVRSNSRFSKYVHSQRDDNDNDEEDADEDEDDDTLCKEANKIVGCRKAQQKFIARAMRWA